MNNSAQLAKHFREVYFGGNWTCANLKDCLSDVNYIAATKRVGNFNTIAALTYHIGYFVRAVLKVLEGGPLDANDKFSFDCPLIQSEEEWQAFLNATWAEGERFARLTEELPDERWQEIFCDARYGTYYRNFLGIIEHTHYHLGQISLIKKMVINESTAV